MEAARRRVAWLKHRQHQRDLYRQQLAEQRQIQDGRRVARLKKHERRRAGHVVSSTDDDDNDKIVHHGTHDDSSIHDDNDEIPSDIDMDADFDETFSSPNFEAESRAASQLLAKEWAEIWDKQQQFAATRLEQYDRNGDGTLDGDECRKLVTEDVKVHAQLTIDRANATQLPRFRSRAEQRRVWGWLSPAALQTKEESGQRALKQWKERVAQRAQKWIEATSDTISKMQLAVDFNDDGRITMREFGEHYFQYMDKREQSMKLKNAEELTAIGRLPYLGPDETVASPSS